MMHHGTVGGIVSGTRLSDRLLSTRLINATLLATALISALPVHALPTDTPAHQFMEQRWGVAEGLPQTAGRVLLQARSGALWIGTQSGLARFDGIDFEVFDGENQPGLLHPYINDLYEDPQGRIWIATEQGLSMYEAGTIRAMETPAGTDGPGSVRDLAAGPEPKQLWLASENGLYLVGPDGISRHAEIHTPLFSLARHDADLLLAGGRGRIWQLNNGSSRELVFPEGDRDLEVRDLLIHEGEVLQGLSSGLRKAPLDQPTAWTATLLGEEEVEAILLDDAGSLWAATVSGLYRQRPGQSEPQSTHTRTLSDSDWLDALMQDREGNLWIGARTRGIVRLSTSPFRRFGANDGLVDDIVWAFYEDPRGHIWAGTHEYGAYRMANGKFEQFAPPEALPHSMVTGFLLDSRDRFWITTRGGVAWYAWPDMEAMEVPPELPRVGIYGITEDRDGRVWLASREGLYWWRDGELQRINEDQGLSQQRTRDVLEDSQGRIWVATDTGIFRGDANGMKPVGGETELPTFTASSLFEINGTVWGMLQGAVARFPDDEVRIYPEGLGLNTSVGSFMIQDDAGYIWTTTHQGIQRIHHRQFDEFDQDNRDHFDTQIYGELTDPIPAQCNGGHGQAGLYQAKVQAFWCPSLEGALRLDLAQAANSPPPPEPRLRQARAGGEQLPLEYAEQTALTLPAAARDLEIDFSGIHFRHPEGVRYRYRLTGFDSDWQDAGERRTAYYTNLPPGDYRFELLTRNAKGVESESPAVLNLHVTPRFHETLWFRLMMLVLVLLLMYGAWRYSVRRLHQRRAVLEQMVRRRTRQLNELNDRLRQASLTDPLTGLRNRRYLSEQVPHDVAQVDRTYTRKDGNRNRDITFLMIDLDHFKRINDICGHRAGDQVLAQFAQILAEQVREADYVVRWGGEEFLVVARHSERGQAAACAERLMEAVRAHRFKTDQGELDCTCSIGLSCYPALADHPDALNWEEAVELADAANYVAKEEGRDRWVEVELSPECIPEGFMKRFRQRGVAAMVEAGELRIIREKDEERPD